VELLEVDEPPELVEPFDVVVELPLELLVVPLLLPPLLEELPPAVTTVAVSTRKRLKTAPALAGRLVAESRSPSRPVAPLESSDALIIWVPLNQA
jgi:hypothetical protein